jgi:predicted nucleic acid-binding protein
VNLYVESSAALRDVLEGDKAREIRTLLGRAKHVVASRLTLAQVLRVLARLRVRDPRAAARVAVRETEFLADTEAWALHPIDEEVLARCARPFPLEPVRMLDAIHLATAERLSRALPSLALLTTDERLRRNAAALGFSVLP